MDKQKKESILDKINKFFTDKGIEAEVVEKETYDFAKLIAFVKDKEGEFEKFVTEVLADGVTEVTIEPAIEVGAAIVLSSEDGTVVAAPVGEYELADGKVLVVAEEGVIAEINEAAAEEEDLTSDDPSEPTEVKRIIESITKTKEFVKTEEFNKEKEMTEFLKGENEHLVVKNTELETRIEDLEKFVKETFEAFLSEPTQEPAQAKQNPFKDGDNYLTAN